jgi:hypothetical protein
MKHRPRSDQGETAGARALAPQPTPAPEPRAVVTEEAAEEHERVARPWQRDAVGLITVFVVTRIVLTAIALVARELGPGPVLRPRPLGVGGPYSEAEFLDVWGAWDSSWYLSIALYGYKPMPVEGALANYGFFPLYPLLARVVGSMVGGAYMGGLVVSNAAFLVACVFLYRLVALDDDVGTARRAVKYLFAAPGAFLFSAMLTESLYLALVLMCFYFGRTRRWWAVGLLGFPLALTRGPGVFAVIPLAWMYLGQHGFSPRRVRLDVLWLALFPAGVWVFMVVNELVTGDAMSFTRIQVTGWGHHLQNPVSALAAAISGDVFSRFNGWYMTGVVVLTFALLMRFGAVYALFVLISVLVPLFYGVPWSAMVRYSVVIFPFYIVAARLTVRRPGLDQAVTVALALLQGFLMSQWANNSLLLI